MRVFLRRHLLLQVRRMQFLSLEACRKKSLSIFHVSLASTPLLEYVFIGFIAFLKQRSPGAAIVVDFGVFWVVREGFGFSFPAWWLVYVAQRKL